MRCRANGPHAAGHGVDDARHDVLAALVCRVEHRLRRRGEGAVGELDVGGQLGQPQGQLVAVALADLQADEGHLAEQLVAVLEGPVAQRDGHLEQLDLDQWLVRHPLSLPGGQWSEKTRICPV